MARRYGEWAAFRLPTWKSEGYADHVAQESSVNEAESRRLRAAGAASGPVRYYEARRRVEAVLTANRGNPDRLFLD